VNETYIKVRGEWKYLFRAIDKEGRTLDFCLSDIRNAKAAKRFLAKALRRSKHYRPGKINTDKNPAYGEAIRELKKEGLLPADCLHRQVKYLNDRLESDPGKLKRLIKPTLGFQSMRTAYATIKGFEVMRMFPKRQFDFWIDAVGGRTEACFVNRLFSVYA
jgi:transposase-like protein